MGWTYRSSKPIAKNDVATVVDAISSSDCSFVGPVDPDFADQLAAGKAAVIAAAAALPDEALYVLMNGRSGFIAATVHVAER